MRIGLLCILAFEVAVASSQMQERKQGVSQSMAMPYINLDAKARSAKVEKPATIDDLAKAVLSYPHVVTIPPLVASSLQTRLSRAESSYRNGLSAGVSETALLTLMNGLASELKLPEYAQVTPSQLRVLRMQLALQSPAMMAAGLVTQNMRVGEAISPSMSPLQATHIFLVMLDQKVSNPDYQDKSINLSSKMQQQRMAFEKAKQSGATGGHQASVTHNPRNLEMRSSLAKGVGSLSLSDAMDLLGRALSTVNLNY